MLKSDVRELVWHMAWADALVWSEALAVPEAASDGNLRERLYHLHVVQWAYLHLWRGEAPDVPEASSFADLRSIREWARIYYREAASHLGALTGAAMDETVEIPWTEQVAERLGSAHPANLSETIVQVASHSAYHRGQINTRLRELGGEPPLTDYIAWIWLGRPAPAWDETAG